MLPLSVEVFVMIENRFIPVMGCARNQRGKFMRRTRMDSRTRSR
jgi:hypothetical protein